MEELVEILSCVCPIKIEYYLKNSLDFPDKRKFLKL